MQFSLRQGDCIEVMRSFPDNSFDSLVTDPPYGLSDHKPSDTVACLTAWVNGEEYRPKKKGFMGHAWDAWVPGPEVWREVFRVLKPGAHVAVFAGSRSHDLMSIALRMAGFECRDTIMWVYGSGFPKSLDVSKAIDKMAGAQREVIGKKVSTYDGANRDPDRHKTIQETSIDSHQWGYTGKSHAQMLTAPATDEAAQWEGWGTALKPAFEPVLLFRKPLVGTVAENVMAYCTGGLNIDRCRIKVEGEVINVPQSDPSKRLGTVGSDLGITRSDAEKFQAAQRASIERTMTLGRWPANLIHDGSDEVVALFPSQAGAAAPVKGSEPSGMVKNALNERKRVMGAFHSDTGSAARFFYCSKASKSDRGPGNNHPTVKPIDLMRYVCRLITPPGGRILDNFCGSGSTLVGGILEGFAVTGVDLDRDNDGNPLGYLDIAHARARVAQIQAFDAEMESGEL